MNFTKFLTPLFLLIAVLIGYLSYQLIYNCNNESCKDETKPVKYIPTEWIAMGDTTGFGVPQSNIISVKKCPCGEDDTTLMLIELNTPLYAEGETIPPRPSTKKEGEGFMQNFFMDNTYTGIKGSIILFKDSISRPNNANPSKKIAILDTGLKQEFINLIINQGTLRREEHPCAEYNVPDSDGHGTIVNYIAAASMFNEFSNTVYTLESYNVTETKNGVNGIELFKVLCASRQAAERGADVINMSFGANTSNYYLEHFYAKLIAENSDLKIVCSAGNKSLNLDNRDHFPSTMSRDLDPFRIKQIAALDNNNYWIGSNKWNSSLNDAARGVYTIVTSDGIVPLKGTSFAAPAASIYFMMGETPVATLSTTTNPNHRKILPAATALIGNSN